MSEEYKGIGVCFYCDHDVPVEDIRNSMCPSCYKGWLAREEKARAMENGELCTWCEGSMPDDATLHRSREGRLLCSQSCYDSEELFWKENPGGLGALFG